MGFWTILDRCVTAYFLHNAAYTKAQINIGVYNTSIKANLVANKPGKQIWWNSRAGWAALEHYDIGN